MEKVNLAQTFGRLDEGWRPKIVGELNTSSLRNERAAEHLEVV